jgi:hypothetical protein
MITPATRLTVSFLSLAALLGTTLVLGACARGRSPVTWGGAVVTLERPLTIAFQNEAGTYADVYLIGEKREWWLGRVAPGARATMRIRAEALETESGFVKLAVLAGAPRSLQAARDPRATFSLAQPASQLLAQRWTFRKTPLASPEILGARVELGRE